MPAPVRKRIAPKGSARAAPKPAPPKPPPPCPLEAEKARVAGESSRREHVAAVKELAFRDFLSGLVRANARPLPPVPPPVSPKPSSKKPAERHALLLLSDWHFEEIVRAESVMGLNAYDVPSACRRVHRVVQAALAWKADREAGGRCRIPRLTVALLGDMVTGTLHGLEKHADAPNVVRAVLACGDLIALALRDLCAGFAAVDAVGVVGNHGRLPDQKKMSTKDPTRSWDYVAYQIARRRLEGQRNLSWHVPDSYGVLFDVAGHTVYGTHGNFIPNSLGVVGYGMRRFSANLAANLGAAGRRLRYAVLGHWHAASSAEFAGIECFINPSLIGTSEFGFLMGGSVNRAAQSLLLFDKDMGLVESARLYGDGRAMGAGTYEIAV